MQDNLPIRILIFFPNTLHRGGMEKYLLDFHHALNRSKIQFDYLLPLGDGLFEDEIKQLGGKIYKRNLSLNTIKKYKVLFSEFIDMGYEIIHFHADNFASKATMGAKRAGFKAVITHSHNTRSPKVDNRCKGFLKRKLTSLYSDYHLAVSDEAGTWLFGKNNYQLAYAGINPEKFSFNESLRQSVRSQLNIKDDDIVVGNVGRIYFEQKNQMFLLPVIKEMQNINPHSKLVFVGGRNDFDKLREGVEKSGIKGITLVGEANSATYYSALDVVCAPSFFEGLPITKIESIVNGLHYVNSTNVPIARGLEKFETRLTLDDSPKVWAEALLKATTLRQKSCPKEFYESGFYYKNAVKNLEDIYTTINERIHKNEKE